MAPEDGFHNVSSNTNWFGWHNILDHTPNDTNGRMVVINADFTPGEFYRTTVGGLCENTTYEFSSWMINLLPSFGCSGSGIPINVKFEIWDSTDTNLLASGDTGNINGTSIPNWEQYGLVFKTIPGQTAVLLKMINNSVGGCGNDLALDDITFRSCGDAITIKDSFNMNIANICEDEIPYMANLKASPDFSIFSSHFYQWQESTDGINWIDISGETGNEYTTSLVNNTRFYRAKVAEDAINVGNDFCNSTTEIYQIKVVPFPSAPMSNGNLFICENDTTPLSVSVPEGVIVNWYDAPVGGNLLLANSTNYRPSLSGVYYTESETIEGGCLSTTRTAIQIDYFEVPEVTNEAFTLCENTSVVLQANPIDPTIVTSYLWSNGNTTNQINVSKPGTYSVVVSNNSCSVTKTIVVSQIDNPIIESIESNGKNIIVTAVNTGDFLYSIDGNTFQSNPMFFNIEGGQYTIYIKHRDCDEVITTQYIHFYIPKFFTPNTDGENDAFNLKGIEFYNFSQVSIFDRYGKLLKNTTNTPFSWNGTFNNQNLPTGDYWYVIIIENQKMTGHVTLKR